MAAKSEKTEVKPGYTRIRLFKDSGKYKDDLTVGLNGKFYQIKRGETVEIPDGVAEIIEHSLEQQEIAARYSEGLSAEYERKKEALE